MLRSILLISILLISGALGAQTTDPDILRAQQLQARLQQELQHLEQLQARQRQIPAYLQADPSNPAFFFNPATEITQIFNNIELVKQVLESIKMVRHLFDQLQDMKQNSLRAVRTVTKDIRPLLNKMETTWRTRLSGWALVFSPNHKMNREDLLAAFRRVYGDRYTQAGGGYGVSQGTYNNDAWKRLQSGMEGVMATLTAASDMSEDLNEDIEQLTDIQRLLTFSQGRQQSLQYQGQLQAQEALQTARLREGINTLITLSSQAQANTLALEQEQRKMFERFSQARSTSPSTYRGR